MGNDGGSIPTRRELVKEAARNPSAAEMKESQLEQQAYLWTTDPISLRPLAPPIVSDWSGKLYNKETILELLVEGKWKDEAEKIAKGSITSLKDVVNIHFEVDDEAAQKKDGLSGQMSWKCPVTGDKLGPGSKAVYLVPCGHAFSGRAIKEVSSTKCLSCETEFLPDDVIVIAPTAASDITTLTQRCKALRDKGLTHSLKKASGGEKKRKKKDRTGSESVTVASVNKEKQESKSNINNAFAASITAKVLEEQDRAKKRRMNDNVSSLFSSRDQAVPSGKSSDFMTRGFSVPAKSNR